MPASVAGGFPTRPQTTPRDEHDDDPHFAAQQEFKTLTPGASGRGSYRSKNKTPRLGAEQRGELVGSPQGV